jgi:hypothetical protein
MWIDKLTVSTPNELKRITRFGLRNVTLAIRFLCDHNYIKRVGNGLYEISISPFESARGGADSARECAVSARGGAVSARECAVSARECAVSARECAVSARGGAVSARGGADSARGGADSARECAVSARRSTVYTAKSKKPSISKVKFKKESKVKKEKLVKEEKPTTKGLLGMIPSVKMPKFVSTVGKVWLKFRETEFSPDLLHRIVFAVMEFGVTESELNGILTEANNALKATDKRRVSKRWMLISKRIQTIYETEGYCWTPCRPQNTAWAAEKKLARQESRDPRLDLFPMERDKLEQRIKTQSEKQQELTEQELAEAEQARREFLASSKFQKPQVQASTVSIDLPATPPPASSVKPPQEKPSVKPSAKPSLPTPNQKNVPLKPAARVLPKETKPKSNNVRKTAGRILTKQEVEEKRLKDFIEKTQKKQNDINKKLAELQKKQNELEQARIAEAEKIVYDKLTHARIIPKEIPDTEDNECFKYPEKVIRKKKNINLVRSFLSTDFTDYFFIS